MLRRLASLAGRLPRGVRATSLACPALPLLLAHSLTMASTDPEDFITRWQDSGGHERGSGQMFLTELCDLLALPHPDPPKATTAHNDYVFERALSRTKPDGSQTTVFLDLYKAGHFVLETKQGVNPERNKDNTGQSILKGIDLVSSAPNPAKGHGTRDSKAWDKSLERAYEQARHYIRDLPSEEAVPPFLLICDVGYVIEIYADFSGTRGTYAPFPVAGRHRIYLEDLREGKKCNHITTNPVSDAFSPKVRRKRAVILSPEECADLLSHSPPAVAIMLFCGIRQGEMEGLDWKDVDLEDRTITVSAQVAKREVPERFVAIPDCLAEWLLPLAQRKGPIKPKEANKLWSIRPATDSSKVVSLTA